MSDFNLLKCLTSMTLKIMQVTQQLDRTRKESNNSAAAGTKSVKCKPKLTNPKPFRLRTDVKKEAILSSRFSLRFLSLFLFFGGFV